MIDRAIRLARASSSTTSVVLLVGFNLVPLAGVLFWGWNVSTLLILYWVENGIVGILNVPKILLAEGPPEPATRVVDVRGIGPLTTAGSGPTSKAALVVFFLVHYGMFWFVHGIFVFTLPLFFGAGSPIGGFRDGSGLPDLLGPTFPPGGLEGFGPDVTGGFGVAVTTSGPNLSGVVWAAIGLAVSHTASFLINYVGRGEYRLVSPARQMFAPYGRLVILHVAIIFGAFVSLAIGSPIGAVIVLVLLKTAVDLRFHLREHVGLDRASAPI